MQRRKLVATAGALSAAAFATTVGLGANFGLFGLTEPSSPVGRLDPSQAVSVDARVQPDASPAVTTPAPIPRDADD